MPDAAGENSLSGFPEEKEEELREVEVEEEEHHSEGEDSQAPPTLPRVRINPFQLYPRLREHLSECLNNLRAESISPGVGATNNVRNQHDVQTPRNPLGLQEDLEQRQCELVMYTVAFLLKALLDSYFFLVYILAFLLFLTYICFLCAL